MRKSTLLLNFTHPLWTFFFFCLLFRTINASKTRKSRAWLVYSCYHVSRFKVLPQKTSYFYIFKFLEKNKNGKKRHSNFPFQKNIYTFIFVNSFRNSNIQRLNNGNQANSAICKLPVFSFWRDNKNIALTETNRKCKQQQQKQQNASHELLLNPNERLKIP